MLPLLWMFLIPVAVHSSWSRASTFEQLKLTEFAIVRYKSLYNRLPDSLAEVRAFLRSIDIDYSPYDNYGHRLQYVKLSANEFFIKSFGPNQRLDTQLIETDLTIAHMKAPNRQPLVLVGSDTGPLSLYPAPALLGASTQASGDYYARLVVEQSSSSKRLIVLHKAQSSFVMASFHDSISEFFWLPDGRRIVFSATGSERYRDGIYIWNLENNETINLLDNIVEEHYPQKPKKFYIALSSVSLETGSIYVLLRPALTAELSPREFYHFENLIEINSKDDEFYFQQFDSGPDLFEFALSPSNQVTPGDEALPDQRNWASLPTSGSLENTIEQWQSHCAEYSESPTFPYCLWWLASLYNDAYRVLNQDAPDQAHTIRSFGIEVSRLLDEQIVAPEYLRAMGFYLKTQLENDQASDYEISDLSLP
ncbi:hypothetical protein [Pseudobacteriovorax antillogorgiicola]|uniref:hypothetical protein n=1 Tax=Pseudobacteriovorax antillogorgiicola TaxID=1513793 RepID=UPI001A9E828A|nr:hypothetical protein [Pseudobacteriovorax antillogorgiicola]